VIRTAISTPANTDDELAVKVGRPGLEHVSSVSFTVTLQVLTAQGTLTRAIDY